MANFEIDYDKIDDEEFLFHTSILQKELEDVRKDLADRKNNGKYAPIHLFKSRGAVPVSDVSSGLWCEMSVEYRHLHPHLSRTSEWEKHKIQGKPILQKTPGMLQGSSIHYKRELEVHKPVSVVTVTREDHWAVQLLTMYQRLLIIKNGEIEREINVFGDPYGLGVAVTGVIDQAQYCLEDNSLILLEFKTRKQPSLPREEQMRGQKLQLMLYKNLLDGLTQGTTNYEDVFRLMKLNMSKPLSNGPLDFYQQLHIAGLFPKELTNGASLTLGEVVQTIKPLIVKLGLPEASCLLLHYQHQGSGQEIGVEMAVHDQSWAMKEVKKSLEFWLGQRESHGVDIEDAWKCATCQFAKVCVWKRKQETELSLRSGKTH